MADFGEKEILAFATEYKRAEIIKAAGISRRKYEELRKDQKFLRTVAQRRAEIVQSAVWRMEADLEENLDKLQSIIRQPEERSQVSLNALNVFFSVYERLKSAADVERRLCVLEEAAEDR